MDVSKYYVQIRRQTMLNYIHVEKWFPSGDKDLTVAADHTCRKTNNNKSTNHKNNKKEGDEIRKSTTVTKQQYNNNNNNSSKKF